MIGHLPRRPWRSLALLVITSCVGCAQISQTSRLRVDPLEKPRQRVEQAGKGHQVSGKRVGATVQARVRSVNRCRTVLEQRAMGFRRTTRRAEGASLALEWVFGALFSAAGTGIIAYNAMDPPAEEVDGEFSPGNSSQAYVHGTAIGVVGLALLAGATWQQWSLGVHETPLGERTLRREGRVRTCGAPAPGPGRVRLTLDEGLQIEADAGADGVAILPLPDDIEARLQSGGRRATLEVKGDWRSQIRLHL